MENKKLPYVAPEMSIVEIEILDLICGSDNTTGPNPGETAGPNYNNNLYEMELFNDEQSSIN